MPAPVEILSPNDKPALLGVSTPEFIASCDSTLRELGYKVHTAANHDEFQSRYRQVPYHVIILEELFDCATPEENQSLQTLQWMPMPQRRHATMVLVGDQFQTMHALQAFNQSVHAVINPQELVGMLAQIVPKLVADNNLFLDMYRESQIRIAQGKA